MWQVTYDDGDIDDMTWQELFQHRADRPIRNAGCRGRVLQCLELFSGKNFGLCTVGDLFSFILFLFFGCSCFLTSLSLLLLSLPAALV